MTAQLEPGTWSDQTVLADTWEEDSRLIRAQRVDLLNQARDNSLLSDGYIAFLEQISSATTDSESATRQKIEAALTLKREEKGFDPEDVVAYIGSGVDWQFPVALGARTIHMIDTMSEEDLLDALFLIFEEGNYEENYSANNAGISFYRDFGVGREKISLVFVRENIVQYQPEIAYDGVVEIAGPTKGMFPGQLVSPHIRDHLSVGAKVINLDYAGGEVEEFYLEEFEQQYSDSLLMYTFQE